MNAVIDNETGVAIPEATQKSIAHMNKVAAGISDLQSQYASMPDCSTDEGYALAKTERKAIGKVRIDIEKAHKEGKAFYLEGGRAVDKMKNDILAAVTPLEDARKAAIKAIDDEKERIEREAAEAEQARIDAITETFAMLERMPANAVTLEDIEAGLSTLKTLKASGTYDSFDEFRERARGAIDNADFALCEKKKALEAQAAEAARLEEQRAEQERIAAEQKAAQDKLDQQQRELAEQQAEAKRQEEQAAREKELAAQAEIDKQEALEAAEAKRLADIETAKQDAAQAERDKAEKAEAARVAKEQQDAADKAEAERLAAMAPDADRLQEWLVSMPDMKSKEDKAAAKRIADNVAVMIEALSSSKKSKAA